MPAQRPQFLSAQVTAIAHATEDIEKVERAARYILGLVSKTEASLTRRYLTGHHRNVITTVSAKLSAKELSPEALNVLSQRLSESDRSFLSRDMKSCVDEDGSLYLRFDKQDAFMEKLKLHQADPVRLKLRFASGHDFETIVDACRKSGLVI
jgi:RNA binding exosome subunit